MNLSDDVLKRTLSIKRTFNAPIALVWEAWSKAEHIVMWWGPPGMETTVKRHEFRVGGSWEYIMKMPDGKDFIAEGTYSSIEDLTLIESSANFKPMTEGVIIQANFEEQGERTAFIFNVIHPTEAYAKQQEDTGFMNGWGSVFDRLEELVSKQ